MTDDVGRQRDELIVNPFESLLSMIDKDPHRYADDVGLYVVIPKAWPTIGDLRKWIDEWKRGGR